MQFTTTLLPTIAAALALTSTFASATEQPLAPLRRRAQSAHREAYAHARDGLAEIPLADLAGIERHLIKLEQRYGSPDSAQAQARREKYAKRWLNHESIDLLQQISGMFESEQDSDSSDTNFDGVSHFATDHAGSKSSQVKTTNKAAKGNTVSTISLSSQTSAGQDVEYYGDVNVGTPSKTFKINFDTGSADFWVSSQNCTSKNCRKDRTKLNTKKSSTFSETDKKFKLQYGIGGVSGNFGKEDFSMGDIKVKKQTIGVATKLSQDYATDEADGVMGLGFRSITSGREVPPLNRIFAQNEVPNQVLSFAFGRSSEGKQEKSEVMIGDVNNKLYSGDIDYTPLTKQSYWQIDFDSFSAEGASNKISNVAGIVDTGTSSIAAPASVVADFYKGIKGVKKTSEGYYTFPCSSKFTATFTTKEGKSYNVKASDLNLGRYSEGSKQCVGSIMSADTGGPVVFGLSFLKNVYTVFDFGNKRVGFAKTAF